MTSIILKILGVVVALNTIEYLILPFAPKKENQIQVAQEDFVTGEKGKGIERIYPAYAFPVTKTYDFEGLSASSVSSVLSASGLETPSQYSPQIVTELRINRHIADL